MDERNEKQGDTQRPIDAMFKGIVVAVSEIEGGLDSLERLIAPVLQGRPSQKNESIEKTPQRPETSHIMESVGEVLMQLKRVKERLSEMCGRVDI